MADDTKKKTKHAVIEVKGRKLMRGRGKRKCRICENDKGLIRSYGLYVCRRCFREVAPMVGFSKY